VLSGGGPSLSAEWSVTGSPKVAGAGGDAADVVDAGDVVVGVADHGVGESKLDESADSKDDGGEGGVDAYALNRNYSNSFAGAVGFASTSPRNVAKSEASVGVMLPVNEEGSVRFPCRLLGRGFFSLIAGVRGRLQRVFMDTIVIVDELTALADALIQVRVVSGCGTLS
jgi:hypothetical protein